MVIVIVASTIIRLVGLKIIVRMSPFLLSLFSPPSHPLYNGEEPGVSYSLGQFLTLRTRPKELGYIMVGNKIQIRAEQDMSNIERHYEERWGTFPQEICWKIINVFISDWLLCWLMKTMWNLLLDGLYRPLMAQGHCDEAIGSARDVLHVICSTVTLRS